MLGDAAGRSVWIPDLEDLGLMGSSHDYFEMGNLDIFSGRPRGPCMHSHPNLPSQHNIRWMGTQPRLVLRIRGGHVDWAPHRGQPIHILRGTVACH
ncbi:hypothetical protein BVC80_8511g9 [Macleaya cordata]|uniref:Uncharacterized protein n=1 Tax=Macleaya cordata TaxID=56857 RepID=A0A200QDS3_MACCD|nr:hypothetical protein BVC80_8511g9 [Macleaya cordata]